MGFILPFQPHQNCEGVEQGGDVKILPAPEAHVHNVPVSIERWLELFLREINCPEIEPCGGVLRVGINDAPERGLGIRIPQLALVKDSQVIVGGDQLGVHLLRRRELAERGIQVVRLHQGQTQVKMVGGESFPRGDYSSKFADRFRVLRLFVIAFAEVPVALE